MLKRSPAALVFVSVCASLTWLRADPSSSSSQPDEVAKARAFVERLQKEEYDEAVKEFDEVMRSKLPADKLKEFWSGMASTFGKFKQTGKSRTEKADDYFTVFIPCVFEKASLDAKIVFKEGRITGLFFAPSAADYKPPKYVKEDAFREIEVRFGTEEWRLPGTLRVPIGDGPFPAVVLVHGSGANDRDETVFANKPFRDVAGGLASQGIAVLTYDKRTFVHAAKVPKKFTVKDEVIDDVMAAVDLLRQHKEIDGKKVFVLGHSLGGTLVPRIAEANGDVAGFIVMSGPVRPLEDLMLEQFTYLASLKGELTDEEKTQLEASKKEIQRIKDLKPDSNPEDSIMQAPACYWLDLRGYEPAKAAAKLKRPLLVLQGERDYQVTMVDFGLWKKQLEDKRTVRFKSYPKLNHLMMGDEKSPKKGTPDEYLQAAHVDQEVIDDIAAWVKKQ